MSRFCDVALGSVLYLLAWATAGAADAAVYRWVDEQGRVHYSQVVPPQYRSSAKPVGTPATTPTPEQQREALDRAHKDKAGAAAIGTDRPPRPAGAASAASAASAAGAAGAPAAARPADKRPAQIPDEHTDCDTWQRLYLESIECFGPFRTVRGGIKPEAFEVCNTVAEPPSTRCRVRTP